MEVRWLAQGAQRLRAEQATVRTRCTHAGCMRLLRHFLTAGGFPTVADTDTQLQPVTTAVRTPPLAPAPPHVQGEDDGSALLPAAAWLAAREGDKPVGVYALYDDKRNLQYVGYARNMVLAVRVSAGFAWVQVSLRRCRGHARLLCLPCSRVQQRATWCWRCG